VAQKGTERNARRIWGRVAHGPAPFARSSFTAPRIDSIEMPSFAP
jgi:hypothetical protein